MSGFGSYLNTVSCGLCPWIATASVGALFAHLRQEHGLEMVEDVNLQVTSTWKYVPSTDSAESDQGKEPGSLDSLLGSPTARGGDVPSPGQSADDVGTALCVCGHTRSKHIYDEGACRPGYRCQKDCKRFDQKMRYAGDDGTAALYEEVHDAPAVLDGWYCEDCTEDGGPPFPKRCPKCEGSVSPMTAPASDVGTVTIDKCRSCGDNVLACRCYGGPYTAASDVEPERCPEDFGGGRCARPARHGGMHHGQRHTGWQECPDCLWKMPLDGATDSASPDPKFTNALELLQEYESLLAMLHQEGHYAGTCDCSDKSLEAPDGRLCQLHDWLYRYGPGPEPADRASDG